MNRKVTQYLLGAASLGLVAALAACTEPAAAPSVEDGPVFNTTDGGGGYFELCKLSPEPGGWGTFSISADGPGTLPVGSEVTLPAGVWGVDACVRGWNDTIVWVSDPNETGTTDVTVQEIAGGDLSFIVYQTGSGGTVNDYDNDFVTLTLSNDEWGRASFKNEVAPPPPGGEGCTPGYWKQSQHFDSWVGYSPSDLFVDVFGRDAFPGQTLLNVLENGGGGLNALGRHTVAALLDAASSGVDYGYTTAEVIQMFQDAYDSGDYETQKNLFDEWNNRGCPLN